MDADLQAVIDRISKARQATKTERERIGAKSEQAGNKQLTQEELERYGILKRYADISFETVESRGVPESVFEQYEKAREYANNLIDHLEDGTGLVFAGSCGTMKTTLAVCILRKLIENNRHSEFYQRSGMFIPMVSLIDNIYNMRNSNKEEAAAFERRLRTVDLLVLDDLGGENTGQEWIRSKVDSIITERHNRMKPVIITTNLSTSILKDTYGARIIDRLRETTEVIIHAGDSLRTPI